MAIRTVGSLGDIQRMAEREKRTVTVYAPVLPADLPLHFGDSHVELKHVPMGVDREFVVVSDGDEAKTVLHLDDVEAFTERATGTEPTPDRKERYEEFLSALADTTFSSLNRSHLMAATREFEDRAYRVGDGTLHAGFQHLSNFENQLTPYRRLGENGIEVHVYGTPDWSPPNVEGVVVHPIDNVEISESWFVAFDGGGDDGQKCALLADQRGNETFHGFWTYEPTIVDSLIGYLEREYND